MYVKLSSLQSVKQLIKAVTFLKALGLIPNDKVGPNVLKLEITHFIFIKFTSWFNEMLTKGIGLQLMYNMFRIWKIKHNYQDTTTVKHMKGPTCDLN